MKTRAKSFKSVIGLLLGVLCTSATVQAAEKIVWASYGGAWADVMKRVCIKPFNEQTGIEVALAATDDSMAQIRVQQMTKNILWDISPTERDSLPTGEKNGWYLPIDWKVVDPDNKLPPLARKQYAIGSVAYSTVIAYRTDKLPAGKTFRGWQDFWNVKEFPGPRSLRNSPVENLEFALIADGVDPKDVYTVLATPEGLDRAFKKLDEIRPSILVWWTSGQQPSQLLASGEVFYVTSFNGRIKQLQDDKVPVDFTFNGGSLDVSYYSIQKGAKNPAAAQQFMKYCWNDPQKLAEITRFLPYSGFHPDMDEFLSKEELSKLPTYEDNLKVQFTLNSEFWTANRRNVQTRWDAWRLQ